MILIADSGSTKTTWCLLDNKKQFVESHTQGFSPSFQTTEEMFKIMLAELPKEILQQQSNNAFQVFYYGTGCSTEGKVQLMHDALATVFTKAHITVNHDLFAAAIALCGNKPGIACILGTGSNSCYFDGVAIKESLLSVGYFFGDHGSGAHIGKTLLQHYLEDALPTDLQTAFKALPEFNKEYILENVYKKPMPQRFLASYTKVISNYRQYTFIQGLVKQCFADFFIHQVEKYSLHKQVDISFVGSVALHFKEQLQQVMQERGLKKGIILQSPMEGLIKYHLQND
ncbi:MAG TPA: BadF/BadG/BcrA/BcrD ATPase family protein [Bacteroidia bacterium]